MSLGKIDYFSIDEFACPCCGKADVKQELLERLTAARIIAGCPFVISSGYRCKAHNAEVGGKPNSAHLTGEAVDIRCFTSATRFRIVSALLAAGFTRIGIAKTFVHADVSKDKPHPVIWVY